MYAPSPIPTHMTNRTATPSELRGTTLESLVLSAPQMDLFANPDVVKQNRGHCGLSILHLHTCPPQVVRD